MDSELNFQDTKTAFADKTNAELKEKYRLFKMMNSPFLTEFGTSAAQIGLRLGLPIKGLIKSTVFKQFCGGETIEECQPTIDKLGESNIGAILDYSVEGKSEEAVFDSTKNEIYRTVTRAKEDEAIPFAVFKVTGLARNELLKKSARTKNCLSASRKNGTKPRRASKKSASMHIRWNSRFLSTRKNRGFRTRLTRWRLR